MSKERRLRQQSGKECDGSEARHSLRALLNDDIASVAMGANVVFVQILLCQVHAEQQNCNQAKI